MVCAVARYMMFAGRNCVLGCQPITPAFQSSLNVICLSRNHKYSFTCSRHPVFPYRHRWVQVIRYMYLHSTGGIAAASSTFSAEAIFHQKVLTSCFVHFQDGGSTLVINHRAWGDLQALLSFFNQIRQDDLSAVWHSFESAVLFRSPESLR